MKLNQLFTNAPDIDIEQLSADSRLPMRNAIFFCLNGIKYNGHKFVDQAIENGAIAIIYSEDIVCDKNAIYIKVKNVNETLYRIADLYYNHPNEGIDKYLVSGCYGRSSVSTIIKHYLDKVSTCGSVGVFGINYMDRHLSITFPALTALDNLKTLDTFKTNGIKNAIFETSAISLYYKKLDVVMPDIFIYTNTSRDCSDFKVCNNSYFENIRRYLYTLEDNTCVLFNADDESFDELNESVNNYRTYGLNQNCDYQIKNIHYDDKGISFTLEHENIDYKITSKLKGKSNIYNLTAAISALNIKGHDINTIIEGLSDLDQIDGVYERIDEEYNIIVDCGYEQDSVKSILEYAKKTCKGRLIGIIGINYSDSDVTIKNIVSCCEEYLDVIIYTEDETSEAETMNILARTDKFTTKNSVLHIPFRSKAIENGVNIMKKNDTLLILGKGNETFLNMGLGKERYYGDKYYALKYLNKRRQEENEII